MTTTQTPTATVWKTVRFYAYYKVAPRKFAQILVERNMAAPGVCLSKKENETGVFYKSDREAQADMIRLNC